MRNNAKWRSLCIYKENMHHALVIYLQIRTNLTYRSICEYIQT